MTPPYHHGDLPRTLIRAARDLLRADPGKELSLREVAKAAGVSHAAPYRHFPTVAVLRDHVRAELLGELADALTAAAEATTDPEAALRGLARAYLRQMMRSPGETRLVFEQGRDEPPPDSPTFQAAARAYDALLGVIARGQREGVFDQRDPAELANAQWALIQGVVSLFAVGKFDAATTEAAVASIDPYLDVLMSGVRAR